MNPNETPEPEVVAPVEAEPDHNERLNALECKVAQLADHVLRLEEIQALVPQAPVPPPPPPPLPLPEPEEVPQVPVVEKAE